MIKKVAIIIERAEVSLGGAERSMFEVAGALSSFGLQVDLLAATGQPTAPNVHILCPNVPGKRVSLRMFADALRRHVSQAGYDILHSVLPFVGIDLYQPRGGTYAESALRNAGSYASPLVRRWKRKTAFANLRRWRLLRAERLCCDGSGSPIIAALSNYVVEQLKQHYATDPRRIVRILNGIDIDQPIDPNITRDFRPQVLARLGFQETQEPVLFLFAANNFRLKGLHPLIQALQVAGKLGTERPARLIVAGAGKEGGYRRLASRMGVEKHILFLGPDQDVRSILPAVDVGVLPTFYDPSSRFILEALAAGRPVITTRFNGAIDHFTDGRHGKVIDSPDSIRALADAIRHFTSTANLQGACQAIAADNLRANISIRRVAAELQRLYEIIRECRTHPAS
jgi:UDP-glucose:(heptosyl)LPS alpha-1,3-glucosyltransferase